MAAMVSGRKTELSVGSRDSPAHRRRRTCIPREQHPHLHGSHTIHWPRLPGSGCIRPGSRQHVSCPCTAPHILACVSAANPIQPSPGLAAVGACFGAGLSSQRSYLRLGPAKSAPGPPVVPEPGPWAWFPRDSPEAIACALGANAFDSYPGGVECLQPGRDVCVCVRCTGYVPTRLATSKMRDTISPQHSRCPLPCPEHTFRNPPRRAGRSIWKDHRRRMFATFAVS